MARTTGATHMYLAEEHQALAIPPGSPARRKGPHHSDDSLRVYNNDNQTRVSLSLSPCATTASDNRVSSSAASALPAKSTSMVEYISEYMGNFLDPAIANDPEQPAPAVEDLQRGDDQPYRHRHRR